MRSLPYRKPFISTIGGKVLIGLLVAALLPLIASILVSLFQMNNMNSQVRSTSSAALINSAQQSLQTQAANIDQTISKQMKLIANTTQELASYAGYLLSNPDIFGGGTYDQIATITRDPAHGQWYNPVTEPDSLFITNKVNRLTPDIREQINILTYMDSVFKAHYDQDQYPTYIGTLLGVTRYYAPDPQNPAHNANLGHGLPPNFDVTKRPWFVAANQQNDPEKVPVFTSLYFDATGKGLVITSSAPVYTSDGKFVGSIGRDVTLANLLSALPAKVGQNGYAFLVGQDGNILSMPEQGQRDFNVQLTAKSGQVQLDIPLDQHTPGATPFTQSLSQKPNGLVRLSLQGNPKYLAFNQVEGIPWDVVLVMPESEILGPVTSLNTQLDQQISQTEYLSLGLTIGLIVLAAIIATLLSRNIAQPLLRITNSAQYLATGQSMYQSQEMVEMQERMVQRRDEVGDLARAFDAIERYFEETSQLADQIAQGNLGVQVHRTSDQDRLGLALENMMSYLNQILQVAATLAAGDLSQDIQPHSSSDVLGNALKYMLDELRGLVVRIQTAAREIEAAAAFVLQRSAFLVDASERQMEQITHATDEAGRMAESNHRVAEDTYTLARVAYSARGHAQAGYEAVQQTISGMSQIQEDVKLASQRVGQLTRRSQEITHVVEIITNIAHQTNRLALDAAIHASAAGANGRNFNMVATNIRQLSEQVKGEAGQIAHLIQTIVEETSLAIQATKQSQQRVTEGMGLASSAGTALEAISNVVDQQGQLVEVINQIARQQRDTSVLVAQEMQAASDITNQYSAGTRQTAQSIERLAYLARQLKESIEAFTLPGGYSPEPPAHMSQVTGMHIRPPVRSARPTPLLPQGNPLNNGMNGM
jgi:methyl-accepting chemotaxis protein